MATTANYGWSTPDDTSLVKDGASAIRTLGSSIDTTTKNLNPSTTLGDIEYRSSTANTNTRLPIGSSGQVLTVSGGVPAWTTISSGGWTQIAAANFPTNAASFSISSIPTTYKFLRLILRDFHFGASANDQLEFQVNNTNSILLNQTTFPEITGNAATASWVNLTNTYLNNGDGFSIIDFNNYADTTVHKQFFAQSYAQDGASSYRSRLSVGTFRTTSAITEINIRGNSLAADFAAGNYILYGGN